MTSCTSLLSLLVSSAEARRQAQVVSPIDLVVSGRPKRRMYDVPPDPQGMRSRRGTEDQVGVN